MASISHKFKHGDIIIYADELNSFGKVLTLSKTVHARWARQVREIVAECSSIPSTIVIARWSDGAIRCGEEGFCRLATPAELILYGQKT